MQKTITNVETLAELQAMPGYDKNVALLLGKSILGDGMAAHYYWDDTCTDPQDNQYLNVVRVTVDGVMIAVGGWRKVIARIVMIGTPLYAYLVYNGGKKELYVPNVSVLSDGTATVNLTMDGSPTGVPIFTEIWFDDSKAIINSTTANDAVSSCRKSLASDLKTLTHLFFRGNSSTISLLGVSVLGLRTAAAGTKVTFKIEGI